MLKPYFGPLLAKKLQNKIFPKKDIKINLKPTRVSKLWVSIFHKTWKTSFWVHFGFSWPKHLKIRFFSTKSFGSILKINAVVTSCKNHKNTSGFTKRWLGYFFAFNILQEYVNKTDVLTAFSTYHSPLLFSLDLRKDENRSKD